MKKELRDEKKAAKAAEQAANQTTQAQADEKPADATPADVAPALVVEAKRMSLDELTEALFQMVTTTNEELAIRDERLGTHDGDLYDHEVRLAALENKLADSPTSPTTVVPAAPASTDSGSTKKMQMFSLPKSEAQVPAECRVGEAYTYKDFRTGTWGITPDYWKAKQVSHSLPDKIYVWYDERGNIDRELNAAELLRYVPDRA